MYMWHDQGNESDVGNIDLELQALKRWQILMFYTVFELHRIVPIPTTRCPIKMGFESTCSILNGQVIYIEKSKLNIANMWLIPLGRVTNVILRLLCMYIQSLSFEKSRWA